MPVPFRLISASAAWGRSAWRAWRGPLRLSAGMLLVCALFPGAVFSLEMDLRQYPQREQLELRLGEGGDALPDPPMIRRSDDQSVRLVLPAAHRAALAKLEPPSPSGDGLLAALEQEPSGLVLRTNTAAFGFVSQYDPTSGLLLIDFFPDPLGRRWREIASPPIQPAPLASIPADPSPVVAPEDAPASLPPAQPAVQTEVFQPVVEPVRVDARTRPEFQPEVLPDQGQPLPPPGQRVEAQPRSDAQQDQDEPAEDPDSGEASLEAQEQLVLEARTGPGQSEIRSPIMRLGPEHLDYLESAGRTATPSRADSEPIRKEVTDPVPPALHQPAALTPPADETEEPFSAPTQADDAVVQELDEPADASTLEQAHDPDAKYRALLTTARAAIANTEFEVAIEALQTLANLPEVPESVREEVLYGLGDALFGLHLDNLADNFTLIAQAYERAMNFNPKSRRRALALRNLGVLHLRVNNLPEAKAYFNVLRRDYSYDPLVPTAEYYLGQYFWDRGDFNRAADYFQVVVQNHPEHSIAQESSVGLARALNALGFDQQAFQIMDFLEMRWPRYYIDDPSLLELAGIIALRVNALEPAKQRLLTYYNLVPDTPDAHMLLARIGDIYLLTGKPDPARRVFEKTAAKFPDQEGGLIAKMRLVEGGIHDDPSLEDMFTARRAAEVYSKIITKHPESPLAAVATIKLAIWQIWNKRLEDSLMVVSDFLESHPQHSLVPKALEVGIEAFGQLVQRNVEDARYTEILEQWEINPFLHELLEEFSPGTQLGLAMAFWKAKQLEQAIALARPYLGEETPKQVQLSALELILGIFLEQQEWERIVDLEPLRAELPQPQKRELTYAVALALENLERSEAARQLWQGLAEDLGLTETQRGYALYFLARTAMQEENFERVYLYAQESLSLLFLKQEDTGKIRDAVTWLTLVTERTGRFQEALAWALELDQLIEPSDPDWSMSRYRLAQLYQRLHNHAEWEAVLEDLRAKDPDGLYGRLAASALQGRTLEDSAGRFIQ